MKDRREESRGVEPKPQGDHRDVEEKEADIEQKENNTDRVSSLEVPWYWEVMSALSFTGSLG
jgi:hypothetical protein